MNIFGLFERRVAEALERLTAAGTLPPDLDLSRVLVEPPRDPAHGDLSTNAAMAIARAAKMNPRALAELVAEDLRGDPRVTAVEIAGPGFINLRLAHLTHHEVVRAAVLDPEGFGRSGLGAGRPVNVEFVSVNPTGPMHVGHGRNAAFGDALANLLAFAGFDVTREYYVNDAGGQVDVLARSAFVRYREALGDEVGPIGEGLYPGDYLKPVGAALAAEHGRALADVPEAVWLPVVRDVAIRAMMDLIRADLAALGVGHDVFFSERSLTAGGEDRIAATIADLRVRNLVYEGRLAPPKGQPVEDWEDREQTLFRATEFGDDVDRPLLKSDGAYTYFAADIAYHRDKVERGFLDLIDVWGADHGGYVKRMAAAVKAVSAGGAVIDVKLIQLVRLLREGQPVKMSKRAGEFVTLRDVVDEVGADPIRFMMLYRKNDAALDFDLARVVEQSKDNPVFYVQYAHARCASVFRQAEEAFGARPGAEALAAADLSLLTDEAEVDLARRIGQYPRVIDAAAAAHEPHRVSFYLYELAGLFHALWNKGKDLPQLRFVKHGDQHSTVARLALVAATKGVIASGLSILGVAAPDEMR